MKKCIRSLVAGTLVYLFLAILFGCYRFGFPAVFQFDDFSNLSWLSALDDDIRISAQVFAGIAGPSGRPLSLAAFLIDGYYWPFDSAPFHRTNTLLHLLNGCLLIALLDNLRALTPKPPGAGLTILAACIWMALPLSASTVLLTVQRMTLLSATFSLAGIAVYLAGRGRLPAKPRSGSALMAIAVAVFTPLAVLSKENGALLPLYLLVIEAALLPPLPSNLGKPHKIGLRLLVVLPVIALFAYLGQMLFHFDGLTMAYSGREFTLSERLQSEAVILWEYLRLAFLPDIAALGPFQDAHPVFSIASHPGIVFGSCAAWLAVTGIAFYLRKTTALPFFAVCWFLAGHLLESTIIPLELYFEHRNYLPLIGPVYALIIGSGRMIQAAALRYAVPGAYLAMQILILSQTTQLWGDSIKSAYYWAGKQPDSIRAAQFLAQQLLRQHRLAEAQQALERALARHPRDAALLLQQLQLRCESQNLVATLVDQTQRRIERARYSSAAVSTLNALIDLAAARRCSALDALEIQAMLDHLMQNSTFAGVKYHLHHLKARLYEQQRQLKPALHELEAALKIDPTLDTFLRIASMLIDAGYYDAALQPLSDARNHLPENPFVRRYWLRELDAYTQEINGYRNLTQ
jgi:tetratricopeptide (TPR) repeat protein